MKENRKALPNRPTTRHLQMSKSKKITLREAAKRKGVSGGLLENLHVVRGGHSHQAQAARQHKLGRKHELQAGT